MKANCMTQVFFRSFRKTAALVFFWLLAVSMLAGVRVAYATDVSGVISSNTTWTEARSPYRVYGDVVLDGNARLTIQPGVEVRMMPGASFTLRRGSLQAVGTAEKPIVITSDAAQPKPGDWRQWRLTTGTNSAQTMLEHVQISWGSGLVIEGSSPALNNLSIQHSSGPAISIDLAASPMGRNLSASNNALNAIAVPAGTIREHVVWGLVGIPYLVRQGIVQVGQSPLALEPTRLKLSPGVVAILRLALNTPAPVGGLSVDLTSSVPSAASVTSRVTVPEGEYGADVEIQANSIGNTVVTASTTNLGAATTFVDVVDLPALELVPANPTIGVQRPTAMILRTPQPAPAGGLIVALGNSDNTVLTAPGNLLVPEGQQSVAFEVTGLQDGVARLSAEAEGLATGLATITVRGKALVLPRSIVVAPGAQTQSVLQLTEPAPAGGLKVNLSVADSNTATVPASITVSEQATETYFNVEGISLGSTQVTASAAGYQGAETPIRVDAIAIQIEPAGNIRLNEEQSTTRRIRLSKPAPPGGITIGVSADQTIASVRPAELFVPEGQIYALSPVTVQALAEGETLLEFTAPGLIEQVTTVTVGEKIQLQLYQYNGRDKVVVGTKLRTYSNEVRVRRLVNGSVASGAEAVTVNLRCVAADICSVPETVTIPANGNQVYFQVTGLAVGSTQIEATAEGATSAMPITVEVIEPQMDFISLDNNRTTASVRDDFYVRLSVPGATYSTYQYAIEPLAVNLALTDQEPDGVVSGIYTASTGGELINSVEIRTGQNSSYYYSSDLRHIAQPTRAGTYRVSAEIAGVASGQSSVQTVTAAEQGLQLYQYNGRDKVVVGTKLRTYSNEVRVRRLVNGSVASGAEAVTVSLRCVAADICSVPETVTIPANGNQVYFQVTGLSVGSTQIEATAEGATSAIPITVEVIEPQMDFISLDNNRTTASVRDDFYVRLSVPGATYSTYQYAIEPFTVNLALTDQEPDGVVSGMYTASTGGELINSVEIRTGQNSSYYYSSDLRHIAQPTKAGTYRVSAEITGVTSGQSSVQTVTAAEQGLQLYQYNGRDKVVVGKGLRTYKTSNASSDSSEIRLRRVVNGSVASGAEAVTVSLRCVAADICSVPETVTIPANGHQVNFHVTGLSVGSTQIEATAEGATAAIPMTVEVIEPQINFSSLDNHRTTASVRDNFSVHLSVPGANWSTSQYAIEPLTVNLALTDQEPDGVVNGIYTANTGGNLITQAVISANNQGTSTFYIAQPGKAGTYRVSAEITGVASGQSSVQTVTAAEQGLQLYQYNGRDKVVVGKGLRTYKSSSSSSDSSEVRLRRVVNGSVASGAEAVTVSLRCVAADICSVPETVTIPANGHQVNFHVTGLAVGSTQIEATAPGFDAGSITVETITPELYFSTQPPASLQAGRSSNIRLRAHVPSASWPNDQTAAEPTTVTLTSAVPSVATAVPGVNWPAGQTTSGTAAITGVSPGQTTVTASSPGFKPVTSNTVTITP